MACGQYEVDLTIEALKKHRKFRRDIRIEDYPLMSPYFDELRRKKIWE